MVVYFKDESAAGSAAAPQGMIEQGAQVKEGQKLLRIPNLDQMQVNTKVHEAMVSRIQGDVRVPTGSLREPAGRAAGQPGPVQPAGRPSPRDLLDDAARERYRDKEYYARPARGSGPRSGWTPSPNRRLRRAG